MANDIFRALIARPPAPAPYAHVDRYVAGLFSSYLDRASDALVGARGFAHAHRTQSDLGQVWRDLHRAAENLCKAVRIAHGLSATRSRDLAVLVHGGPGVACGLPRTTDWAVRLAPLAPLERTDLRTNADLPNWFAMLHELIEHARVQTPPPKRSSGRQRATPRTSRPPAG